MNDIAISECQESSSDLSPGGADTGAAGSALGTIEQKTKLRGDNLRFLRALEHGLTMSFLPCFQNRPLGCAQAFGHIGVAFFFCNLLGGAAVVVLGIGICAVLQ